MENEINGYAEIGKDIIDEAQRAVQWHRSRQRVAQHPKLSLFKAKNIVWEARRLKLPLWIKALSMPWYLLM